MREIEALETNIQGLNLLSSLEGAELRQLEAEVRRTEAEYEENRKVHERREATLQNCTQGKREDIEF